MTEDSLLGRVAAPVAEWIGRRLLAYMEAQSTDEEEAA